MKDIWFKFGSKHIFLDTAMTDIASIRGWILKKVLIGVTKRLQFLRVAGERRAEYFNLQQHWYLGQEGGHLNTLCILFYTVFHFECKTHHQILPVVNAQSTVILHFKSCFFLILWLFVSSYKRALGCAVTKSWGPLLCKIWSLYYPNDQLTFIETAIDWMWCFDVISPICLVFLRTPIVCCYFSTKLGVLQTFRAACTKTLGRKCVCKDRVL